MSLSRRAAKRDANEAEIIKALEAADATVVQLSGENIPDLLVGWRGENILMEVKSEKGKLRKGQETFIENWNGDTIAIVRSVEDAIEVLRTYSDYQYTRKLGE